MAQKNTGFIFFIGDEGAVISYVVGKRVEKKLFVTSSDGDSLGNLQKLLNSDPQAPISLLLDSIDQSYQTQSFPPVAKLSVQKLVDKRLERDFSPGDITSSLPLGKEKTGRNDWKFLLISVVPSPQLMQWVDFVLDINNPFKGIFLVPVEAENFIRQLSSKKKSEQSDAMWHMLVLHNKVSGFRQIITRNGRLTFTRLTQASSTESVPLVIAGNIEQEIVSTIEYLKRLSFRDDEGLDVTVIAAEEVVHAIDEKKIGPHNEALFITPTEAAEAASLPAENYTDNHFVDIIFSAAFHNSKKKVLPLHTKISKVLGRLQSGIMAVKYATFLFVVLIILGIAFYAYSWFDSFSSEGPLNESIQRTQQQVNVLKKGDELLPDDIEKIEDAVSIYETFAEQKYVPLDFVEQLIDANKRGVLIRKIDWNSDTDFKKRAKKQAAFVSINVDIEFTKRFPTAEARLGKINEYLDNLRVRFPEYIITHTKIPGTLNEGGGMIVDFTNPKSRALVSTPIIMSLRFSAGEKVKGARR
ncbi:MAG: hypothetical protein P8P30_08930 [Rickettsiales bacterium]|nr:hypothetical protein [Rickettsiales bacterium]